MSKCGSKISLRYASAVTIFECGLCAAVVTKTIVVIVITVAVYCV